MKFKQSISLVFSILIVCLKSQQICPSLTCDAPIGNGTCFQHSGDSPVTSMKAYDCDEGEWCQLNTEEYAWVQANKQRFAFSTQNNSQVYQKIITKKCEPVTSYQQKLNNGRLCEVNGQCVSNFCNETMRCQGKSRGDYCSHHYECDVGLTCLPNEIFPFQTSCRPLLGNEVLCNNDYDCQNTHFCWALTEKEARQGQKICLEMYSQEVGKAYGNFMNPSLSQSDQIKQAGRFCKSGIAAFPNSTNPYYAECTEIAFVRSNYDNFDNFQSFPYRCRVIQNETGRSCQYFYRLANLTTVKLMETSCECNLEVGSANTGICPIPGQREMTKYVDAIRTMIQNSQCHRMDQMNLQAQKECGIGQYDQDKWKLAAEMNFNITYWPNIQSNSTNYCMRKVMALSPENLMKSSALNLLITCTTFAISFFYLY